MKAIQENIIRDSRAECEVISNYTEFDLNLVKNQIMQVNFTSSIIFEVGLYYWTAFKKEQKIKRKDFNLTEKDKCGGEPANMDMWTIWTPVIIQIACIFC